jgi:hypothetical protein
MDRRGRGALAGAVAAAVWTAAEPSLKRTFGTPYADSELLSAFVTRGRLEPLVAVVLHSAAGAGFGYAFVLAGGRGVRQGIAAALAENTLFWPMLAVFDRIHPRRRDGTWPRLTTNARVFAQSSTGHALFGGVLGALV